MRPRRIILVDDSRFTRDILRKVIVKMPGLQLMGEYADLASLPTALRQTDVEWVILSQPPRNQIPLEIKLAIMSEFPSIPILEFCTDGSHVSVLRVGQQEKTYGGLTWDILLHILLVN